MRCSWKTALYTSNHQLYVCMWRHFLSQTWIWLQYCDLWKSSLVLCPQNACTAIVPLRRKGSIGVQRGPTEHFIQVAMHVRQIKSCKWLPVIVPIKEQLRVAGCNMAALLCLPPLHDMQICICALLVYVKRGCPGYALCSGWLSSHI